ncbi:MULTISPECIES: response regulator [unclassified Nostoc]|uniref:response regulator transcription factor n=1 Tax=unclassified Nostoc TaxID=2593658 RepID=UPI002AD1DA38|nr:MULTISPECIES: response regulator [unclassified Nostoc]MDZ8126142.1 response regulator [Nostoc sp. CmiVER01]MDZ8221765.1 response regulator [Nostoc sp. ChiVER01]
MTKILVIEDEQESRDIFLDSLEAEGFEAIAAENGLVGIQQAQEHLPDLVLCDILMPELDGYGVLNTLRQNPLTATIPFIFLSAKSTKTEVRQGMNLGADDYLTKPSTVEELLEAIATRLEKQATMRQCYVAQSPPVPELQSTDADTLANSQSLLPTCPQLKEVFDFIEANYYQSITLCDVAQAVGYSAAYLTDLVRRQTGKPVNHWIVERRMAAVRTLLLETNQSANQIAEVVGYQNEGHFFRQFRQYHGTTPKAWRKAQQIQ